MSKIAYWPDPEIALVPIEERGDPLIDLREIPALLVGNGSGNRGCEYALLRSDVANRLVTAQTLLPTGLRLLIMEGYRPAFLQRQHFEVYVERLRTEHPERDEAWLRARAARLVAPEQIAPHVAGAAVHLTLCTASGAALWMGTEIDDTGTQTCYTASTNISDEARVNRAVLVDALTGAGLVNYPAQWWHWSYGDRYWAYVTGAPAAHFGPLAL